MIAISTSISLFQKSLFDKRSTSLIAAYVWSTMRILYILPFLLQLLSATENNCNCPKRFHPVCGSDALSYNSICHLQCASSRNPDIQLAHNGSCCSQLTCSLDRDPVCDNFGRTHQNDCFFNRARCLARKTANKLLSKVHFGECTAREPENCLDKCSFPGVQVCDHLGNTHESECQLEQTNCYRRNENLMELLLVWYSPCNGAMTPVDTSDTQFPEPKIINPPVDANVSDISESLLEGSYASSVSDSSAETLPCLISPLELYDINQPCSAANCDKTWNPVCDENNKTHKNLCLFKFHACKVNRLDGNTVVLLHEGECTPKKDSRSCKVCSEDEDFVRVCDNLNHTHASFCAISRFNCFQRLNHKAERVLVHIGPCYRKSPIFTLEKEKCPRKCSEEKKPVCDEAGVTHHNLCSFQKQNCQLRQEGKQAPMLKSIKECGSQEILEVKTKATVQVDMEVARKLTGEVKVDRNGSQEGLDERNSTVSSSFECPLPMCVEDNSSPVCDSEEGYHENLCMFTYKRCLAAKQNRFLTVDTEEKCLTAKCNETCENTTRLICGSDLNTYQNDCFFLKEKCKDPSLEVMYYGSCSECLRSPCAPSPPDAPDSAFVCDSEDSTRSLCEYQMLSCFADKNTALNFTILHVGKCCGSLDICRNKTEELLCGKDGRTYMNQCELDLENCRNEKLLVPTTEVDFKGECKKISEADGEGAFLIEAGFNFEQANNETDIKLCNETCGNLYSPVCGTDETTYTSICHLALSNCKSGKGAELAYNGECCNNQCPSNFDPVCDNEDTTHQNLCVFGQQRCIAEKALRKNLTIARFDVCTNVCSMICTKEYIPVCGTNGITYVNMCEIDRQNCFVDMNITTGTYIQKDYDGECCPDLKCDFNFAPVCDSDGTTHANACAFRQAQCVQSRKGYSNISVQYEGQCCNQPCENDYTPVCDGNRTHENICRFRIAQCDAERRGLTLSLAYSGECCTQQTGNCQASGTVCDSFGQTHTSLCQFELKRCLVEKTTKKSISVVHKGECCSIEVCHKGASPVCDNRGGTHASMCHFQNTQCIHNKIHPHSLIQFAYNGSCCLNNCGDEWSPVCDQHGAIYENKCRFQKKACELSRRRSGLLLETPCTERRIRRLVQRSKMSVV